MRDLLHQLVERAILIGLPGTLLVIALLMMRSVQQHGRRLIRVLQEVDGFLQAMSHGTGELAGLVRAVREHVVVSRETERGTEYVLSKPLAAIRREYADAQVSRVLSFSLGSLLTGGALIFTFGLIAYVMTFDVSGAIQESGDPSRLSDAVAKLGAKFWISAAGVLGSIMATVFASEKRSKIMRVAEHPDVRLNHVFTSLEVEQLNATFQEMALLRRQHAELCAHLETLNHRVEKLNSIDVSVRDIGNEVSANLKNVMKEAMADELKSILVEVMAQVETIAARVQSSITDAFGEKLQALAANMQQSLDAVRKAIEGQAQGQLEQILDKLQATVSGGLQSESKNMAVALERFAKVVPALEEQLRAMTAQIATETRQRAEEGSRVMQDLLDRVGALVRSMEAQQSANAETVAKMQAASAHAAEEVARRLEASGASLVSTVMATSRSELEAISKQLEAALTSNAVRIDDIEQKAASASEVVARSADALARSAESLGAIHAQTQALLAQVRDGTDGMKTVSHAVANATHALLSSLETIRQIDETARAQTQEQQSLLMQQRQFTREVEQVWPTLFDAYLGKFKQASDELQRSWADLHAKVATLSQSVGSEFAENTLALSEAIKELVHHNNGRHAAR